MRSNVSTIVAAAVFLALALTNVVLMLEASIPSRSAKMKSQLIAAHRVGGYLFVILFCIMAYSMSQRLGGSRITGHLPTYLFVHIVLALSLVPLLLLKLLIARRYTQSYSILMALGTMIFVISFVLVSVPAFSMFLRSTSSASLGLKLATGLFIAVCLLQCLLILHPTRKLSPAAVEAARTPEIPAPAIPLPDHQSTKTTLLLAQIEQQTHDTKTLRFLVPQERRLSFKPGQFLTLRWRVNGQRVSRSYTISSSPTRTDYVEITPKRMENGCVSIFLNDHAKPGLTVEASGPNGQFYFDETIHPSIALLAAGSGITPMISMLRYIDDFRLPTAVTLLYCVRTRKDIIFETELERLGHSLPNFNYRVCLSQPDEAWRGQSGHLSEQFVSQHVTDLESAVFFVCGPRGFMDKARQILSTLGVNQNRILQESFGESKRGTESRSQEVRTLATVVFVDSQKVCQVTAGNTLLEVAERNGVRIPYGCRQGECGTCVTRVLSGTVRMDTDVGLTAEHKTAGYVLPCVSRAEGMVVVAA